MTSKLIRVSVDTEPHSEDLGGVLLNRPAPQGGSFVLDRRVDEETFAAMKQAGAVYWSAEDLEEFDMFDSEPGWYFGLNALKAALAHGYTLQIRGESVATAAELDALFTPGAIEVYHQRVADAREAQRQAQAEAEAAEDARREKLGREYAQWQAEHLAGLVLTYTGPNDGMVWEGVGTFSKETPGAWYTTGDAWYKATLPSGEPVYMRSCGNAVAYYAPQDVVARWCQAWYDARREYWGEWVAAVEVLRRIEHVHRYGQPCIGDDVAQQLVAAHGIDHFVDLVRQEAWLLTFTDVVAPISIDAAAVRRYGLPAVYAHEIRTRVVYDQDRSWFFSDLGYVAPSDPGIGQAAHSPWRDEEGRLYGRTWMGRAFLLTEEQSERARRFIVDD